ncbi:hypothetical protein [Aureivirga sp. CE67]|uniref:hypothetical protein n=1 Tax=Aureivirga sp. CE67 TaxID=1788983 RepID=UPI0018C98668|nr:hypothetical protein [Aureivirga sp. CE67]
MKKILLLLTILICSSFIIKKQNIKEFYFPIEELKSPKIYKYEDFNSETIVYWRLSTEERNGKTYFITRGFNENYIQIEFFEEEITEKGAFVTRFSDIYDTKEIKNGDVINNEVYSWEEKNEYSYKVKVKSGYYSLEKKRKLGEKKVVKKFKDLDYDCIVMNDLYITSDLEYPDVNQKFTQETYYAKGIGIIGYKRFLPNGKVIDFKLTEIIKDVNKFKVKI